MSSKISKITIDIDKKKVELTMGQAKQLKEVLEELFGKEVEHHHTNHYIKYKYPYWRWDTPLYDSGTVNCSIT